MSEKVRPFVSFTSALLFVISIAFSLFIGLSGGSADPMTLPALMANVVAVIGIAASLPNQTKEI